MTKWNVKDGVRRRKMVCRPACDKAVCEIWCVCVCESCVWKRACDKVVCERWCVTKWCVKDGVAKDDV